MKNNRESYAVGLVSVSFPGRDLGLSVVNLKSYAMQDEWVRDNCSIDISQFTTSRNPDEDDSPEEIYKQLGKKDLYGFSTYVWNMSKVLEVAELIKQDDPDAKVVLGGPQASGMAEKLLDRYASIDYIVSGEGERPFVELLKKYPSEVPNLVYRRDGEVVSNPILKLEKLLKLPRPHASEDYKEYVANSALPVRAAIETSRGCPFKCVYCSWGSRKMQYFDMDDVKKSLDFLFNDPNVRTIYITDSNPFLNRSRGKELLEYILENNTHKKPVTFELYPEYVVDDGMLEMITQLSNGEFMFGFQSNSPTVLGKIQRNFDSEKYRSTIKRLRDLNKDVQMWFSLIIGLPGDDYEQYKESLDFVLALKPAGVHAHELLCLPGSRLYDAPEEFGLRYNDDPPHKLTWHETFPTDDYNRAKHLSYHVHLIHHIPELRDEMGGADDYERFVSFLDGRLDTLSGERVEDVSSWFFEQYADKFLNGPGNVERLMGLHKVYVREVSRMAG